MANQIFMAHSQDDEELLDQFDNVFGHSYLRQYKASFEEMDPPVSNELKNQIERSQALFVILGRGVQTKDHTMVWIGWEAGVAVERSIPVWIFQDIESRVKLPIPSFSDYVLWDSRDTEQKRMLRDVIEGEFVESGDPREITRHRVTKSEGVYVGNVRNSARVRDSQLSEGIEHISCPWEDCGEEYNLRFLGPEEFNCPSCRQPIELERMGS